MMSEFMHQLVQRPEDILENAEERVGMYKDIMLHPLEVRKKQNNMIMHNKKLFKISCIIFFLFQFEFIVWRWAQGMLQHLPKFLNSY